MWGIEVCCLRCKSYSLSFGEVEHWELCRGCLVISRSVWRHLLRVVTSNNFNTPPAQEIRVVAVASLRWLPVLLVCWWARYHHGAQFAILMPSGNMVVRTSVWKLSFSQPELGWDFFGSAQDVADFLIILFWQVSRNIFTEAYFE